MRTIADHQRRQRLDEHIDSSTVQRRGDALQPFAAFSRRPLVTLPQQEVRTAPDEARRYYLHGGGSGENEGGQHQKPPGALSRGRGCRSTRHGHRQAPSRGTWAAAGREGTRTVAERLAGLDPLVPVRGAPPLDPHGPRLRPLPPRRVLAPVPLPRGGAKATITRASASARALSCASSRCASGGQCAAEKAGRPSPACTAPRTPQGALRRPSAAPAAGR